ncbi:class I SAM-dependent methyltransferase [Steroidobacter sp.]|uniref:class I SAM-dependent methyltransferase n=1 Tax=Steroidobacter sp. TaxID=1978227 RepID=UPI001A5B7248|nr:class I SAM-dependent methyltransferase [Steroidobacter sp.]MBL8267298.1 class I SAM-dependent methyltransferase [Steroidobacter sp.]
MSDRNIDTAVVEDFGLEWEKFDQSEVSEAELERQFERYFAVFPWQSLPAQARGFDLGCGSGRWAKFVAARVHELTCIDPSERALAVARRNLQSRPNVMFHCASVDAVPLAEGSMDFGYSLGVLHHVPDTAAGIRSCVRPLKKGAPFLLYLYYGFDNRPWWFRLLWKASDLGRLVISRLPTFLKRRVCDVIAVFVYWPLARFARLAEKLGLGVGSLPLSHYRAMSFYTMRTDALDRFGTRLEQRFTRAQISQMMTEAGLVEIEFSADEPYWCAVGIKA